MSVYFFNPTSLRWLPKSLRLRLRSNARQYVRLNGLVGIPTRLGSFHIALLGHPIANLQHRC
jgi:hypothetical protein